MGPRPHLLTPGRQSRRCHGTAGSTLACGGDAGRADDPSGRACCWWRKRQPWTRQARRCVAALCVRPLRYGAPAAVPEWRNRAMNAAVSPMTQDEATSSELASSKPVVRAPSTRTLVLPYPGRYLAQGDGSPTQHGALADSQIQERDEEGHVNPGHPSEGRPDEHADEAVCRC